MAPRQQLAVASIKRYSKVGPKARSSPSSADADTGPSDSMSHSSHNIHGRSCRFQCTSSVIAPRSAESGTKLINARLTEESNAVVFSPAPIVLSRTRGRMTCSKPGQSGCSMCSHGAIPQLCRKQSAFFLFQPAPPMKALPGCE